MSKREPRRDIAYLHLCLRRHPALQDMERSANRISATVAGLSAEQFAANEDAQDIVLRHLGVIGEAAANLSPELTAKHDDVPWRQIVGLRNIVIHAYWRIDLSNVWKIATKDVPEILGFAKDLLGK